MQKFTRNTYEFVKQGLLQIQDEITKGERVCATRALKGIIGTMAPNREALLGYAYVRVRNRVGSKYGNTNRRAEIIAEKVQILMEAFWSRPTHYILDTDQYGAKFINTFFHFFRVQGFTSITCSLYIRRHFRNGSFLEKNFLRGKSGANMAAGGAREF